MNENRPSQNSYLYLHRAGCHIISGRVLYCRAVPYLARLCNIAKERLPLKGTAPPRKTIPTNSKSECKYVKSIAKKGE